MKIGVFGDSFADSKTPKDIWWKYLANDYQHNVECFGEFGSGLVFQDASNAGFNLFDLCQKETANYFPDGQEIAEIYDMTSITINELVILLLKLIKN